MTWIESIYPLGEALHTQTLVVMGFGLLVMLTYGRGGYPRRGWWLRLVGMLAIYGLVAAMDFWFMIGTGGPSDHHGVGLALHYLLWWVLVLFTLGVFVAVLRARRRAERVDWSPPVG